MCIEGMFFIDEWDRDKNTKNPKNLTYGSNKKFWWTCTKYDHSYFMSIKKRNNGQGCPYCSGKKVMFGFNDLQSQHSKISKEWDYSKNKELPHNVHKFSNKKFHWICDKGHTWCVSVNNRTGKNTQCPICVNKVILKGFNDLNTTHPKISQEWNYSRNSISPTEVSYGSIQKIWWVCDNGHEWKTTPAHRSRGTGCPHCIKIKKYSKAEVEIFNFVRDKYKHFTIEKKKVGNYIPDILVENKKIIEYYGNYWHANPKIYNDDWVHPNSKMKASDIHARDTKRLDFFKSKGFETLVLWEKEWNEKREESILKIHNFISS